MNSHLPMQSMPITVNVVGIKVVSYIHTRSVPITTDVVSSNLDQGEVYNIMW